MTWTFHNRTCPELNRPCSLAREEAGAALERVRERAREGGREGERERERERKRARERERGREGALSTGSLRFPHIPGRQSGREDKTTLDLADVNIADVNLVAK